MIKKIEKYYQKLIHHDTNKAGHHYIRKFFTLFLVLFFVLQIKYYFTHFHGRVEKLTKAIRFYYEQNPLLVRQKSIVFNFSEFLVFIVFLFIVIIFIVFTFVAFDISQRNAVIRELKKNQKDPSGDL